MPPPPPSSSYGQSPSIWQKMGMGAAMGGTVGLTMGFLYGSYSILRGGAGPRGVLSTLSQYMLGSAAMFGFFLSIGSVIRSDSLLPSPGQGGFAASPSIVHSRAKGVQLYRARWEAEKRRLASERA